LKGLQFYKIEKDKANKCEESRYQIVASAIGLVEELSRRTVSVVAPAAAGLLAIISWRKA
jgi:hypothetical protein